MEEKIRHLEMIQGIINRMAGNSFMLKGWAVTLIAGVFALGGDQVGWEYYLVTLIPIIAFWGLDSYYLLQERLYRSLYGKVRRTKNESIDFSLAATLDEFKSKKNNYCKCFFSKTEIFFYGPLILICGVVVFMIRQSCF